MNIRKQIFQATAKAAIQEGWTEAKMVNHIKARGGNDSDIAEAVDTYRDNKCES